MSLDSSYTTEAHGETQRYTEMKNKSSKILFVISIVLIILGLLFKILHYSIGFITGYQLMILGIIININVCFNLLNNLKK